MTEETREIKAADGTPLHLTSWRPDGPIRFAVLVSHGQSEHLGRHAWVAEALTPKGAFVFGPDHRGEGRSGGTRGHVEGFETYAGDLAQAWETVQPELPEGCPLLLFSHSMGGLIGLLFLLDHGERFGVRAAVVSAPLIELILDVGFLKRFAARVANVFAPRMPIPSDLPASAVLRDPEILRQYESDPHRAMAVTPRWVASMDAAQARVARERQALTLPMYWYGGTGDQLCSTEAAQRLFDALPKTADHDQTFRVFEGVYHEPHNEPPGTREEIRGLATDWLAARAEV